MLRLTPATVATVLVLAGCAPGATPAATSPAPVPAATTPAAQPSTARPTLQAHFIARVTGTARVQWSEGLATRSETVTTGTHEWTAPIDAMSSVTAMTLVPVGDGSSGECAIVVPEPTDDPDDSDPFFNPAPGPGTVATCINSGAVAAERAVATQTVILIPGSTKGGAEYRAVTLDGSSMVEHLAADANVMESEPVAGPVSMVVLAKRAGDTVSCKIWAEDTTVLVEHDAEGLGAIATCHVVIPPSGTVR